MLTSNEERLLKGFEPGEISISSPSIDEASLNFKIDIYGITILSNSSFTTASALGPESNGSDFITLKGDIFRSYPAFENPTNFVDLRDSQKSYGIIVKHKANSNIVEIVWNLGVTLSPEQHFLAEVPLYTTNIHLLEI